MTTIDAPGTGEADFARLAEPFRRQLLAHCYRMLGSLAEAEDAVQETYLRAWRSYGSFRGGSAGSTLRAWLFRIATNACLTALQGRRRRALPSGLGGPSTDPYAVPIDGTPDDRWLQPVPDALVAPRTADPAEVVTAREDLGLALVAGLQYLTGRQRAVLILRDVLAFPAAEVALMLDTSVAAVKSSLQRARARLREVGEQLAGAEPPTDLHARALLEQYIAGFENADVDLLERALRVDAALEVVPSRTWFSGRTTCIPHLARFLGSPGDWRMVPAGANGQPAVVAYLRGSDGVHAAFGIAVLTVTGTGIARITVFLDAGLVAAFGAPATLDGG